ncbi:hypothetical protein K5O24_001950 [Salmonella enterica subsp. enterica serovar Durham]|nr:hypothetical protein [Salmonella enterica subsp. enterica serovar Durham]EHW9737342.1 hypothetical protein [Salmonella enterica subsp. enterica serovar Durham]EHX4336099.1 hypothetical protein [Salmonella enterica subsp. enterica serovar Durham]EHZ3128732.1 hypothetical protein [Salmonella enterica subsp. enterica serovar Durham]
MKMNHKIRNKSALNNAIVLREIADRMLNEANAINRPLECIFYAHLLTSCAELLDDFRKENTELRTQLIAFQKAANTAVAVDLASGPDTTAWYTPFVIGTRVCLKANPDQRGTVVGSSISSYTEHRYYIRFDSEFEDNRWVKARNLELAPNK